jgi:arylsulfatase A-like enzyme
MFQRASRREFMKCATLTGASLLCRSLPGFGATQQRSPNVVMIVGDDQGWPDFGFMGHKVIRTPRLDQLAKESAVFPQGYVPTSLCRASLATLLTGLYPHQHHICCNDPPKGIDRTEMHPFIKKAPALPRLLREAGYDSLQTGKFWEGHFSNAGFTHGETTNSDRHIAKKTPQIGRDTMQPIFDFIDKHPKTPFFVWYAPMMPHRPHNPPERLLQRYTKDRDVAVARYFAMCEWFDETCGQLLDHIDKRKLASNTLVVFVIDNGWIQTTSEDKESAKSPFGGPRGKRSPYDGGIRTPVMLRWPGHTKPGRYLDLVSTIDLAPTILHAATSKVPAAMPGLNLLVPATGKGPLKRNAVFGEIYTHNCKELGRPKLDVTHRWVREGDWKLIVSAEKKDNELFNLARDPHEKNELAKKEPARVKQLVKRLDQWEQMK